jgi:hypothetical protein
MSALRPFRHVLSNAAAMITVTFLVGCSTWQAPSNSDDTALRERAVSASKQDVRVAATVLSTLDSQRMFGADVNKAGVQAIWIEVQNASKQPLSLLRSGTDPDYFSPLEVAWSMHTFFGGATNARIDEQFSKLGFNNPIPPGATRAGVVFTNPQRGMKLVNIDLFGSRTLIPFTLFLQVPNDAADPRFARPLFEYPDSEITDYGDLASLRAVLERMPCCGTDANGTPNGDPLNAIAVGNFGDIGAAAVRRDYHRDLREFDGKQRVFGRGPDVVLRKQGQAGAPATWIRGWRAPVSFQGQAIYVLQVGRPVGGRFERPDSANLILDEDGDEARNLLIQDMIYSAGLGKLGFVYGVGPVPETQPRTTFDGAHYFTDGLRAVLFFETRPLSLSDIEILDWVPYIEQNGGATRQRVGNAPQ